MKRPAVPHRAWHRCTLARPHAAHATSSALSVGVDTGQVVSPPGGGSVVARAQARRPE
jgi:hypothetical protein